MKVGILYFSGTGATAKIAQVIGNQMDDAGHEVSYFRLKENTSDDTRIGLLEDFDLLGLGAPVYSMRIPRIASKILKELPLPLQKPFFVFSTAHGSWGDGNALWNLYKIAQKREGVCLGA